MRWAAAVKIGASMLATIQIPGIRRPVAVVMVLVATPTLRVRLAATASTVPLRAIKTTLR
jgi:hypothetical protein